MGGGRRAVVAVEHGVQAEVGPAGDMCTAEQPTMPLVEMEVEYTIASSRGLLQQESSGSSGSQPDV